MSDSMVSKLIEKLLKHRLQKQEDIDKVSEALKKWEDENRTFLFSQDVTEETEKKCFIYDTALDIIAPIFYPHEHELVDNNKLPSEYYLMLVTDHIDEAMKEVYG